MSYPPQANPHIETMFEASVSGRIFQGIPMGAISTFTLAIDTLYGTPLFVARRKSFSHIGIHVATLEAGKGARLGVFKMGADRLPAELIVDAGVADLTLAVSVEKALAPLILERGWYVPALVSDATGTAQLRSFQRAWSPWGWGSGLNIANQMYSKAQAYGALPDPFGVGAFGDYDTIYIGLREA